MFSSTRRAALALLGLAACVSGATLTAQQPGTAVSPSQAPEGTWNDAGVLDLVERAREARGVPVTDSALASYRAQARGYVYFFVDRPDADDHLLVKADQVALELFWRAPNDTKQRIVGLRDEKVLPTQIRYHLDHLTVVQDDFADFIRLGNGDEVEQVLHPMGPGSGSTYDFLLVDSLSLSYAAGAEEVRVYEVRVRPKRFDMPGFVGSVFLDRSTAAIVRMNFSFTPASYVDDYLDYIRISLDNSLWLGRYWLPYRQEVELRREIPLLDFAAGSVIRSRFEIRAYELNAQLGDQVFQGRGVSSLPQAQREAFPFERGLFDDIEEQGLSTSATMEDVRQQVQEVVSDRVMSGLSPVRIRFEGVSDFARYNRAEGVYLGAGLTVRPTGDLQLRPTAGLSFGRSEPSAALTATGGHGTVVPTLALVWDRLGDIGGNPGASMLVNTMNAASGSRDFLDPYFRRGAALTLGTARADGPAVTFRWEDQRSATDVVSDGPDSKFRPVRSIDEGVLGAVEVSSSFDLPAQGRARASAGGGRLGDGNFASGTAAAEWLVQPERGGWHGRVGVRGGAVSNDAPAQALFLIGGRHTLPGHAYRSFVGNAYWLVRTEGTVPVRAPYLGVRAFGVAGAAYLGSVDLPSDWLGGDSDGLRGSVGLGLSIAWDTIHLDLARGVRGGGWEALLSVSEQFKGWM